MTLHTYKIKSIKVCLVLFTNCLFEFPVGKIPKKQSEGVQFCQFGTQNIVSCYQKYTLADCFFSDYGLVQNSRFVSLITLPNLVLLVNLFPKD